MPQSDVTKVEIKNGKRSTYPYRKKLQELGCTWDASGGLWAFESYNEQKIDALIKFALRRKLKCKIYEPGYIRSSDYRKRFFEYYDKPVYRCAYCGRRLKHRSEVSVDHIIPVAAVQNPRTRKKYKRILSKKGITDINDMRNLTSACRKCNTKKSANTGSWILKARLGSHKWYWILVFIFRVIIILVAVLVLFHFFLLSFSPL